MSEWPLERRQNIRCNMGNRGGRSGGSQNGLYGHFANYSRVYRAGTIDTAYIAIWYANVPVEALRTHFI